MTAPIFTLTVDERGEATGSPHDRIRVWNRGGLAGELVLKAGDGDALAELLGQAMVKGRVRAIEALRRAAFQLDSCGPTSIGQEARDAADAIEAEILRPPLPPLPIVEDRTPEQLAADGDAVYSHPGCVFTYCDDPDTCKATPGGCRLVTRSP